MQFQHISISRINPAPYNPRKDLKPDDPAYQRIVKSLDAFGLAVPLVWNAQTGNLVGGHQRFKVLVARGEKKVPVSVVDLSPEREKSLNLALNKVGGEWDDDRLAQLLDELVKTEDVPIETTGFDLTEIDQLTANIDQSILPPPEDRSEAAENAEDMPAVTRPGEIIELGEHRILCGDMADTETFTKLLGDRRARMVFTDPPYGVKYDGKNRPTRPSKDDQPTSPRGWTPIANDALSPKAYRKLIGSMAEKLSEGLVSGGSFYIFNGHAQFGLMHEVLEANRLHPSCVITWAKESFSPGFGHYNEQTEFCMYGWKRGAKPRWCGPKNETTLWTESRDRTTGYRHPTQKALALPERAIRNSSRRDELVLDPFLGSGTTLVAAARLGRVCYGIEIEPRYVDVAVRRYIDLVGASAVPDKIVSRYVISSSAKGAA